VEPDQEICGGKYRLVRVIGAGAFGQVWLAREVASRVEVALKVALSGDALSAQRFQREIVLSRKLKHHPHLLTANTVDRDGPVSYLALPYVPGGSLAERLERGRLAVAEALRVGLAVAEALAYLHGRDLIHRDIHPGNILFDDDDEPLLADLGLAQAPDSSYAQTAEFHPGNSQYHPPEAQAGPGQRVKPALPSFDVYMLGAVLWQALIGRLYFHVKPGTQARTLRPDLPPSLEKLLHDCLSAAPDARPWDGEALAARLRAEQAGLGPGGLAAETEAKQASERQAEAQREAERQAAAKRAQAAEAERLRLAAEAQREADLQIATKRDQLLGPWVNIPAGEFLYGDKKEKRRLPAFEIMRAPVTNAQYKRFLKENPAHPAPFVAADWAKPHNWDQHSRQPPPNKANHPVVLVSWNDAQAYCQWARVRLPTEEEWEKAARGVDGREYPWGNEAPDAKRCNFYNDVKGTTPVGQYSLQGDSPYGCVDLAGNVWEWTAS